MNNNVDSEIFSLLCEKAYQSHWTINFQNIIAHMQWPKPRKSPAHSKYFSLKWDHFTLHKTWDASNKMTPIIPHNRCPTSSTLISKNGSIKIAFKFALWRFTPTSITIHHRRQDVKRLAGAHTPNELLPEFNLNNKKVLLY